MSKQSVYDYIKERTYGKFDEEGQVKVLVSEVILNLEITESNVYKALRKLDLCSELVLVRNSAGKFRKRRYWVE